jgi:SAM-dependent methyltransferase
MRCRGCGSGGLIPVLDLGDQRLPDFTDPGTPPGWGWPLRLMFCDQCTLLQLGETVPRGLLYHERYGFKSGVNQAIRADLADVAAYALRKKPDPQTWLDIACNDGTLLSNVPRAVHRTGIDPLAQFADEASQHADAIISDYFRSRYFPGGRFDVITSVSMFYDLDDPVAFARDVAGVLAPRGVWVIQQNYAADMLTRNAVDNICHEHATYFSVTALGRVLDQAALEISDVTYSAVNGGCIRTLVTHAGVLRISPSVADAVDREAKLHMGLPGTYEAWGHTVRAELDRTRQALDSMRAAGKRVYLYGASTRGGTFLQMIGAGPELLPYAVERQPAKVGKIMATTGIPIISEEAMRADPPDALLVSPWFFRDVFVDREKDYLAGGGQMMFPLPRFEVVTA